MAAPTRITRLSDQQLVSVANAVAAEMADAAISLFYNGGGSQSSQGPFDPKDFSTKAYSIQRIELYSAAGRKRVDICRGKYVGVEAIDRGKFLNSRESSPFDEYLLTSQEAFAPNLAVAIDEVFAKHRIDASHDENAPDLTAIVSTQLEQLRQLALDFSQRQIDAEDRLEKSYRKREDALQKRIEAEEKRLIEQKAQEELSIADERAKIEKWRDEINDREPQHERRRLREILTGELKAYVTNPPTKASSREWLSNWIYLVFGGIFVAISVLLTVEAGMVEAPTEAAFWSNAVKSMLAGLGGAAFIWAGLAGLKASAKSAREYEQQVQRYSFDMDRASWVVETILQMNAFESTQVPNEWLASVCRDLFLTSNAKHDDARPLNALAALLDATARAKFGTNGIDFEIDRKGAKMIKASAAEGQ